MNGLTSNPKPAGSPQGSISGSGPSEGALSQGLEPAWPGNPQPDNVILAAEGPKMAKSSDFGIFGVLRTSKTRSMGKDIQSIGL